MEPDWQTVKLKNAGIQHSYFQHVNDLIQHIEERPENATTLRKQICITQINSWQKLNMEEEDDGYPSFVSNEELSYVYEMDRLQYQLLLQSTWNQIDKEIDRWRQSNPNAIGGTQKKPLLDYITKPVYTDPKRIYEQAEVEAEIARYESEIHVKQQEQERARKQGAPHLQQHKPLLSKRKQPLLQHMHQVSQDRHHCSNQR